MIFTSISFLWFDDLVQQPKEQHLPDHKEEISVCEPVRAEKEKNESSITAEIQASGIVLFDVLYFM